MVARQAPFTRPRLRECVRGGAEGWAADDLHCRRAAYRPFSILTVAVSRLRRRGDHHWIAGR
jgi:hypothetical protein